MCGCLPVVNGKLWTPDLLIHHLLLPKIALDHQMPVSQIWKLLYIAFMIWQRAATRHHAIWHTMGRPYANFLQKYMAHTPAHYPDLIKK